MKKDVFPSAMYIEARLEPKTILPESSDVLIEQAYIADEIIVTLRSRSLTGVCPVCGTVSKRVQSRYTRTLADLPIKGQSVRLVMDVRRFFCLKKACPRKIFAEQFPSLTRPRARSSLRLQATLCRIGLAFGGEAGARLGKQLHLCGSPDTILRLVRQLDRENERFAMALFSKHDLDAHARVTLSV